MSLTPPATPATDPATSPATSADGPTTTRRQVLFTGGVVAAAAAVTAACGSSSSASTPAAPAGSGASSAAPATTVKTSDVPVGGGKILTDAKVVVTQPTAGVFKAFTAVCTHQGCIVASVANDAISCACHGSVYSAADGSVQAGPAPAPLASIPVTVSGDTITVS